MKHMISIRLFSLAVGLVLVSTDRVAAVGTNGFLVIEVDRLTYTSGTKTSKIRQRFKVPLTEEFMSNFRHVPGQQSSGTGFWCSGGNLKTSDGSTRFMWWIRKTADNRWRINMWGEGVETINGVKMSSRNPKTSQNLVIRNWEDLDMSYLLSYSGGLSPSGSSMSISFGARYVSAKEIDGDGSVPAAPVEKADRSELFKRDDLGHLPLEVRCGFQEG